jgi:hypothetical protein
MKIKNRGLVDYPSGSLAIVLLFVLSIFISCEYNKNIATNDNAFTENNICEIHYQQMTKENIRIRYGLIKINNTEMEYYRLRLKYFPNSNDPINGGCINTGKIFFESYICEECNKERDKYKNHFVFVNHGIF